jgi:broad specificity phosphatase PhoE/predicted kinase
MADHAAYLRGSTLAAKEGAIRSRAMRTREELSSDHNGLVIAMVGLPCRGKSFYSRKIENFLNWCGLKTKLFNVGKYRREGASGEDSGRADFFDRNNAEAAVKRRDAANQALAELISFLDDGGEIAILDATNSTAERRRMILDRLKASGRGYHAVFIESLCDDAEVLETNMRNKVRDSPDFAGFPFEESMENLRRRIAKYEEVYEEVADDGASYIKLYNMSSKVLVNRLYGACAKSVLPFLMGVHIGTRPIWIVRAAQEPPGGDKDDQLTEDGRKFASDLAAFLMQRHFEMTDGQPISEKSLKLMTSTATNSVQTASVTMQTFESMLSIKHCSALNGVNRGRVGGSSWEDQSKCKPPFEDFRRYDPDLLFNLDADKLKTRFPGGESYHDVMIRLESVLVELEMSTIPVLCVSHMIPISVLLSYFKADGVKAWDISVPQHKVFEIRPMLGGGYQVDVVDVGAKAASITLEEEVVHVGDNVAPTTCSCSPFT